MRLSVLAVTAVALAGCVEAPPPPATGADPDACGAAALQDLVGQDEGALAAMTFPADRVRVIGPDTAVTMDYRPDRLNIEVGRDGTILRVYCG